MPLTVTVKNSRGEKSVKTIRYISGPVSMYILVPRESDIFPNLPVYMLFGDSHNSDKNQCDEKAENKVDIYSIEFLSILKNLMVKPGKKEVIDFYTEGGDLHNKDFITEAEADTYPLSKIWNLYMECYKNKTEPEKKIALYEHETPCEEISNIRWQSADARNFTNPRRGVCSMYTFLKDIDFNVNNFTDPTNNTIINNFIKLSETEPICAEDSYLDTLFNNYPLLLSSDSLILKQLDKIKDKKQYKTLMTYLSENIEQVSLRIQKELGDDIKKIEDIEYNLKKYIGSFLNRSRKKVDEDAFKYIRENWETFIHYYRVVEDYNCITLDLYTICRSFKYLTNKGPKPIINIIYAGYDHIENIVNVLKNLYNVITIHNDPSIREKHTDKINRCIEIKEVIDLDKIIAHIRKMRNVEKRKNKSKKSKKEKHTI